MKKGKKITFGLLGGFFGICALLAGAWFLPFPIEGNWEMPLPLYVRCPDISHTNCYTFLRFEDGKIMSMSNQEFQPIWFGTYKKKGWGRYETKGLSTNMVSFGVVRSTYLRLIASDIYIQEEYKKYYPGYLFRDFNIRVCREAVNHPSNEWMRVRGYTVSDESELYRRKRKGTK